ncbi:hypothetical protein ACHAW5_002041 [Stephanodiscus triporus]|uniref:AAA+ ATPase domain-containing protein n=1 Tax=Stephanodiscus triporus TaxID=2934178 RepID=A0ABD3QKJ5_9STRA
MPDVDDLLFLLRIVSDPDGLVAIESARRGDDDDDDDDDDGPTQSSSSRRRTLASLPALRRDLASSFGGLRDALLRNESARKGGMARRGWGRRRMRPSPGGRVDDDDDEDDEDAIILAAASLVGVERAATTARECARAYLESAGGCAAALRHTWWRRRSPIPSRRSSRAASSRRRRDHRGCRDENKISDLERAGRVLATQLVDQIALETRLSKSMLSFLDDELHRTDVDVGATSERMRVWRDSVMLATRIDMSLWDRVGRELRDESVVAHSERRGEEDEDGNDGSFVAPIEAFDGGEAPPPARIATSSSTTLVSGGFVVRDRGRWDDDDGADASLRERILSTASVEEAVETFARGRGTGGEEEGRCTRRNPTNNDDAVSSSARAAAWEVGWDEGSAIMTSILLVGDEGCGKTHALDAIQRRHSSSSDEARSVEILRPHPVVDMVGCTIGSTEDRVVALFSYAFERAGGGRKCLVVLDDVDRMFSMSDNVEDDGMSVADSRYHVGRRCKALFVTILDALRGYRSSASEHDGHLLVLCTARSGCGEVAGRFDRIFRMGPPDDERRRRMILSCLSPGTDDGDFVAEDTAESKNDGIEAMISLVSRHSSLRGGSLEGVVDVKVCTPEELQSKLITDENGDVIMPLLGTEVRRVVHARPIRVGALLAGAPGTGKTSLVYHSAAVAAKMARVSLLDVSATSLIHKEIGGSERAVQRLFAAVRAAAPCILLIDGIESVAPVRGNDTTTEGTMDRVLSTFLTEMDGIEDGGDGASSGGNVAVIGVTHRPDMIDPALLRPGRLEKTITLGAPEYRARKEIVARQIEDIDFDFSSAGYFDAKNKDELSSFVANETTGMSAVEVIAICREASMVCLRELDFETTTKPSLRYNHFKRAITIMKGKVGA